MSETILQAPSLGSAEISPHDLFIGSRISPLLLADLVELSREPDMLKHVPDDAGVRFADMQSAIDWVNSDPGRLFYPLTHKSGRYGQPRIAGIIWFTPAPLEEIPDISHTFSIRIYPSAQGKGLALPFMKAAHDHAVGRGGVTGVWLRTRSENTRARHLYTNFGYTSLQGPTEDRVLMSWLPSPTPEVY